MIFLRNLFALIGLLTVVLACLLILAFEPYINKLRSLDQEALSVYLTLMKTVLETGDPAQAMVYRVPVMPGLPVPEVRERLLQAAAATDLHALGSTSVHEQVINRTGESFPFLEVHFFCDPVLAVALIRLNPSMASFLPCRIILHEDDRGRLWLMTPNLDLLMRGGRPLPVLLQERTTGLHNKLRGIIDQAASASAGQ
jgi:uncharacterized protein (DUF302 family)